MTWPADVVLAVTLLESIVLLVLRRRLALRPADIAGLLLPGAALLIALRFALAGASITVIALALLAAGLCHALDLHRRLQRSR